MGESTMYEFKAMNTSFLVDGLAKADCEQTERLVRDAEAAFSRFLPASLITYLNGRRGEWVEVDPLTMKLLTDAVLAYQQTDGLFNPFLGSTLQRLGYDQSFETLQPPGSPPNPGCEQPDQHSISPGETPASYLDFDPNNHQVRLSAAVQLDLGGIAKGWIAQYAADQFLLNGVSHGLIDAGGDIVLWGQEPVQQLWGVGVAHPFETRKVIADLWLEGLAAIATSSVMKRRWQRAACQTAHHIIDPRTQAPSQSDIIQATILARDLTTAEQFAKCLIILGSTAGLPWLQKKRPDLGYIAVRKDGAVITSSNLDKYCTELEVHAHV